MTNREKYMKEICDIATNGEKLAVNKRTLEPCGCSSIDCRDCIAIPGYCNDTIKKWANSEYTEPCPFEKDELVEVSDDGQIWELRYFSHQEKERFYFYERGHTSQKTNKVVPWIYCQKYGTLGGLVKEEK